MSVSAFLDGNFPVASLMEQPSGEDFERSAQGARRWSVRVSATVGEATHLMVTNQLGQILVKDEAGATVGILTTSVLFRWVAANTHDQRPDDADDDDDDDDGAA